MSKIRVRYAPSPTGYLHIGGARSALFNYLFAKQNGGDFILRIEDTDIERNIKGADVSQIKDLEWLGIVADESPYKPKKKYGPYRQTEKLDLYKEYAYKLVEKGYAYECFCDEATLEEMKTEQLSRGIKSFQYDRRCLDLTEKEKEALKKKGVKPSIRLKVEDDVDFVFDDLVRGNVKFNSNDIGDFVILKSNGIPTYNFAVVIDDHFMDITHVLRGEEHLSNTPKQLQIYKYFGWEPPKFGHMSIIVNERGKKLSKRDNDIVQFIDQYRTLGYLPQAIANFLFLLGFSPIDNNEIFTLEEEIKCFDINRLSAAPSMFDKNKLTWINSHYIKNLSDKEYLKFVKPYLLKSKKISEFCKEKQEKIALIFKSEIATGQDLTIRLNEVVDNSETLNKEQLALINNEKSKLVFCELSKKLKDTEFDVENIKNVIKEVQKTTNVKGKDFFMPIRLKLSHKEHGVELYNLIYILGLKEVLRRLT